MDNRNATLVLLGGVLVGGFFIGAAALDHVRWSKARSDIDDEFEAQHYRAAGFRKRGEKGASSSGLQMDDVVSFAAAISGLATTIYGIPTIAAEIQKLGKSVGVAVPSLPQHLPGLPR